MRDKEEDESSEDFPESSVELSHAAVLNGDWLLSDDELIDDWLLPGNELVVVVVNGKVVADDGDALLDSVCIVA